MYVYVWICERMSTTRMHVCAADCGCGREIVRKRTKNALGVG